MKFMFSVTHQQDTKEATKRNNNKNKKVQIKYYLIWHHFLDIQMDWTLQFFECLVKALVAYHSMFIHKTIENQLIKLNCARNLHSMCYW